MERLSCIFALFIVISPSISNVIAQSSSYESTTSQNDENIHLLARDVQIVSAPIAESTNSQANLTSPAVPQSKDWSAIIRSVGIEPDAEKCLDCHFNGQSSTQAHAGNHLNIHRPELFGCILCHGGDAGATEMQEAHISTDEFPFFKGRRVEAACGKCHTAPAVPGALSLSGGRFVLNKYGCVTCHDLPIEIPIARYAPRLDTVGNKVTKAWLRQWLEDPTIYLPESKMPKIEMSERDREAIVEFLLILRNDGLFQAITGTGNAENGRKIFVANECQSCHASNGANDSPGPNLERVGTKINRLWLTTYLRNPAVLHPNTKMPDYEFSDQAILDVSEYLLSHFSDGKTPVETFPDNASYPSKTSEGFKHYISKGCAQCHGITKYMEVNVTEKLKAWDIKEAIERIRIHRGANIETPEIDIPESDLELMKNPLLAMQQNDTYKLLRHNLGERSPGDVSQFLSKFWQFPIPVQGEPPEYYSKTVTPLTPESCGNCHTKQWEDWKTTRHAVAMGPGVWGQLVGQAPRFIESCSPCHAPLSEQHQHLPTPQGGHVVNQHYDSQLQSQGLACATCHIRTHQRFGPPFSEIASAASVFGDGHHGGAVVSLAYKDSAFCKPCHQFEENGFSLNDKLLENTYNEWLESPHAKQGETCQSCHMPDRRHQWRGIHDPETVRNALKLDVHVTDQRKIIEADIRLTNTGAGHYLPTYITPAIFVTVRMLDSVGNPVPDTEQVRAIQRRAPLSLNREIFDTRIPPGGTWVYTYKASKSEQAKTLEIRIDVHPDHFYNGFFKIFRAKSPEAQQHIVEAIETTEQSPYLLLTEQIPLE